MGLSWRSSNPCLVAALGAALALAGPACGSSSGAKQHDAGVDQALPQEDAPVQDDAAVQQDANAPSGIGDPCTSSGSGQQQGTCATGQTCQGGTGTSTRYPGGYCSQTCSDTQPCPWDAFCVTSGGGRQRCMKSCTTSTECRIADGYSCNDSGGGVMVCSVYTPPPGTNDGGACVNRDAGPGIADPDRVFGASQQLAPPSGSMMEAETNIAAYGTDAGVNVAAAYIAIWSNGDSKMAVNTSANGGQTYGAAVVVDDSVTTTKSDPVLAYSLDGQHLFLTWIGYDYSGQNTVNMHPFVARSDDHGATWATAVDVGGSDSATLSIDKPWVATGPGGVLYATYMSSDNNSSSIRVARSSDNGVTWDAPVTVVTESFTTAEANLAYPVVDGSGNLYVGYIRIAGNETDVANDVMVSRWDAGGTWGTFSTPVKANTDTDEVEFQDVTLVASPNAGDQNVYAVYIAGPAAGTRWNVRLAHSTDKAATFLPAITINDDGTCATHQLASAAIGPQGRVHVTWYDDRFGTSAGGLFYAVYDPGTQTTSASQFVSDELFAFTTSRSATNWLGDYTGVVLWGDQIFASWSDPRGAANTSHVRVAHGTVP